MWDLRNKTNEQREKRERERDKPRNRLFIQNELIGGGWGMGKIGGGD